MKTLVATFNQEKALVDAFFVIEKTDGSFAALILKQGHSWGQARVVTSGILFLPKQPPATWCLSLAGEVKRINLDTGKYVGRRKLKRLTYCHALSS